MVDRSVLRLRLWLHRLSPKNLFPISTVTRASTPKTETSTWVTKSLPRRKNTTIKQPRSLTISTNEKTDDGDWMPLGVFAVVSEGQTKSDMTLQLAINKEGMIRGNLSLDLTDEVIPVKGSLDKETQRVAFRLEGKDDIVVEAGLYNLTEDVLTVLVHQGKDKQEERGLVRLKQDDESKQPSEESNQPSN